LLGELRSATHLLTIDGKEYEAQAAIVLVANCAEVIPPHVKFGHGISPEDGELDVIVLRADSFRESVSALWEFLRARSRKQSNGGRVCYARGRDIRVETTPAQPVQLDGEPGGWTPFRATVVPGAVRIMVPPA